MQETWNNEQPIYRQLRDRMVALILTGAFPEGTAIPSVRSVSSEYQINHLTVSKAYQTMVDEGLLEKRRGLGMFVVDGAKKRLMEAEKKLFLDVELPRLIKRMKQLGISEKELISMVADAKKEVSNG